MINLHWSWIVFAVVVLLLLIGIFKEEKNSGDYSFNLMKPFFAIILIAFVLIWGGIFWW